MRKACVILPSYNVEKTLETLISILKKKDIDVLVVDDCSTDMTLSIAKKLDVLVLHHEKRLGKGVTLKDGICFLKERGYEHIILMDADGQHLPTEVLLFLKFAEKNKSDFIIGSRMWDCKKMPLVRRLTNQCMSFCISFLAGQHIEDSQSGFRYLSKRLIDVLELTTDKFEVESEMIINASRLGFKIDSIDISVIYGDEKSNINPIVDTLRFFVFVVKMILTWIFHKLS